ncbi:MAG: methylthioribulose 1-phosphate dehydratase [Candidatus Acidiferrales bacterium]
MPAESIQQQLARRVRNFYQRGWVLGTSGNFSAVLARQPLRLAITASGVDKGQLDESQILEVNDSAAVLSGNGQPSAETLLHLAIIAARGAGSVLHTHAVWSTLLSEAFAADGGIAISGFEMLKGLEGIHTHQHREWLPVLENSQDMPALAEQVTATLAAHPACHGFLLRRHGLYTWGVDLEQAARHIEVLEFLLEVLGRERRGR